MQSNHVVMVQNTSNREKMENTQRRKDRDEIFKWLCEGEKWKFIFYCQSKNEKNKNLKYIMVDGHVFKLKLFKNKKF